MKKLQRFLSIVVSVFILQMFCVMPLKAQEVQQNFQINLDSDTATVEVTVTDLEANSQVGLMGYYDDELDYIDQYITDESGNLAITYPSSATWANGGVVKVTIGGGGLAAAISETKVLVLLNTDGDLSAVELNCVTEQVTGIDSKLEYMLPGKGWETGSDLAISVTPYMDTPIGENKLELRQKSNINKTRTIVIPGRPSAPSASYDKARQLLTADAGAVYSINGVENGFVGGGVTIEPPNTSYLTVRVWLPASETTPKSAVTASIIRTDAVALSRLYLNGIEANLTHDNIVAKALQISSENGVRFKFDDEDVLPASLAKDAEGYYTFANKPVSVTKKINKKDADFNTILTLKEITGEEVQYRIICDKQKPVLDINPMPDGYEKNTGWTNAGPLSIAFTASDDGTGIRGVSWVTNQKPSQSGIMAKAANGEYELNLVQQGKYKVTVTAYDETGKFTTKTVDVFINNGAPENVRLKINGLDSPERQIFYTSKKLNSLKFTATTTSNTGVGTLKFGVGENRPSDGEWKTFAEFKNLDGIKSPNATDAKIWIQIPSKTNINAAPIVTFRDIKVVTTVKTKPKVLITSQIPTDWQDNEVTVNISSEAGTAVDFTNSIAKTTYKTSLKGSVETEFTGDSFALEEDGSYKVTVTAYDLLGNKASAKPFAIKIDKQAPDITTAVIKAGGKIVEQGDTINQTKKFSLSVKPAKQSSSVTAKWSANGTEWKEIKEQVPAVSGTIWIKLTNGAGVPSDTATAFATVNIIGATDPKPIELTVKLGSKLASRYGNLLTKATAVTITSNLKPAEIASIEYQLSGSDTVAEGDLHWLAYNSKSKPLLSSNMKTNLHIKLTPRAGEAVILTFPITVELSEKAGLGENLIQLLGGLFV